MLREVGLDITLFLYCKVFGFVGNICPKHATHPVQTLIGAPTKFWKNDEQASSCDLFCHWEKEYDNLSAIQVA